MQASHYDVATLDFAEGHVTSSTEIRISNWR
jgi:hypothetical protein